MMRAIAAVRGSKAWNSPAACPLRKCSSARARRPLIPGLCRPAFRTMSISARRAAGCSPTSATFASTKARNCATCPSAASMRGCMNASVTRPISAAHAVSRSSLPAKW
ncbi:hypothetical protein BJF78_05730 [Pseudonocardia sp. CNS-139]|nr:hypothetical protein BJF78_05730 [Pseudonocardia sp. CNS-139]